MRVPDVLYTTHFNRAYKKISNDLKIQIDEREQCFLADCFDIRLKTHKLSGKLEGLWAFSITQRHRILFIFEEDGTVTFLDIDDHDMYR